MAVKLPTSMDHFTVAEKQVAACVAKGMSNQAIASRVNRSESAVKVMCWKIYQKLGLSNRPEINARVKLAKMMELPR